MEKGTDTMVKVNKVKSRIRSNSEESHLHQVVPSKRKHAEGEELDFDDVPDQVEELSLSPVSRSKDPGVRLLYKMFKDLEGEVRASKPGSSSSSVR